MKNKHTKQTSKATCKKSGRASGAVFTSPPTGTCVCLMNPEAIYEVLAYHAYTGRFEIYQHGEHIGFVDLEIDDAQPGCKVAKLTKEMIMGDAPLFLRMLCEIIAEGYGIKPSQLSVIAQF